MSEKYVVEFDKVCKIYAMKKDSKSKSNKKPEKFYALKDISFKVKKGETVGILGTNGSGKSTASKILSGITLPDKGEVKIEGEQALIAINSGLNNKLTGLENIELKGVLLGFSKSKIEEITKSVIEFSELGDFIHQPVKTYSSGMKARLGFSISININPDIIIIDEALSVGDKTFNEKCLKKINELKMDGKTIFFVSHSISELKKFCSKGLWIEGGRLKAYDDIEIVAKEYAKHIKNYKRKSKEEQKEYRDFIYKSRLVTQEEIEKQKNKKKEFKFEYRMIAILSLLCLIFTCGNLAKIYDSYKLKELDKDYNYIFMITGDSIDDLKNSYRNYIKDEEGEIITDIFNVSFKEEGNNIDITKVPSNLQYYYPEQGINDEISLVNYLDNNTSNQKKFFKSILDSDIDDIYTIKEENLYKYNNMIKDKKISEMKEDDIKNVVDVLLKGNKDKGELLQVISTYGKNSRRNEIIFNHGDIEYEEIILSELIGDRYYFYTSSILNNKIAYIDKSVDVEKNVYVVGKRRANFYD